MLPGMTSSSRMSEQISSRALYMEFKEFEDINSRRCGCFRVMKQTRNFGQN
jgi:hypothetical protein